MKRLRVSLEPSKELLLGVCEVDASFSGRRRFGKQKLIIGVIDQKNRRIRLKIIHRRDRTNVEMFIRQTIKTGSVVLIDGFTGYNELSLLKN